VTSYMKRGPGKCDEGREGVNFSLISRDVIYGRFPREICLVSTIFHIKVSLLCNSKAMKNRLVTINI